VQGTPRDVSRRPVPTIWYPGPCTLYNRVPPFARDAPPLPGPLTSPTLSPTTVPVRMLTTLLLALPALSACDKLPGSDRPRTAFHRGRGPGARQPEQPHPGRQRRRGGCRTLRRAWRRAQEDAPHGRGRSAVHRRRGLRQDLRPSLRRRAPRRAVLRRTPADA